MSGEDLTEFDLALLLVTVGLFFGALTRFIQQNFLKIPIPYTVLLLIIGVILGLIENSLGKLGTAINEVKSIDPHLLLGAFILALIFESAFGVTNSNDKSNNNKEKITTIRFSNDTKEIELRRSNIKALKNHHNYFFL